MEDISYPTQSQFPRDAANFDFWLKADVWSLCEAASLINGLEPPGIFWDGAHGIRDEERQIRDLAARSISAGLLKPHPEHAVALNSDFYKVLPSVFTTWAASKGLEIPEPLRGLVNEGNTKVGQAEPLTTEATEDFDREAGTMTQADVARLLDDEKGVPQETGQKRVRDARKPGAKRPLQPRANGKYHRADVEPWIEKQKPRRAQKRTGGRGR